MAFASALSSRWLDKEVVMVYEILDSKGSLVFSGRNWLYARAYLDYLLETYDKPFRLFVSPIA